MSISREEIAWHEANLKRALASVTLPCPGCGGPPIRDREYSRICPICEQVFIFKAPPGDPISQQILDDMLLMANDDGAADE